MTARPDKGDPQSQKGGTETRWWMWIIAFVTVILNADIRLRLERGVSFILLAEAVLALVGLVIASSRWRGRIMPGFLLIGAAVCVLKVVQVAAGS